MKTNQFIISLPAGRRETKKPVPSICRSQRFRGMANYAQELVGSASLRYTARSYNRIRRSPSRCSLGKCSTMIRITSPDVFNASSAGATGCVRSSDQPATVLEWPAPSQSMKPTPPLAMRPRRNASFCAKWRGGLSLSLGAYTRQPRNTFFGPIRFLFRVSFFSLNDALRRRARLSIQTAQHRGHPHPVLSSSTNSHLRS